MDYPILTGAISFVILLGLLMSGIPVAIGLGLVAVGGYVVVMGDSGLSAYVPYNSMDNFVLTAVPLFILMGEVLLRCGMSERLYRGTSRWVGGIPGGLLHSNVVSCALFAAICGSSPATAATIGTIALPALEGRGYDTKLSLGSLAAGGTLGILIPPSISLIVYGSLAQTSVGRLFAGGVVPGIMISLMFMLYIGYMAKKRPGIAPVLERTTLHGILLSLVDLWPTLLVMFIVLGGIFGGLMTPTEAAAIGAAASFGIALALRELTWRKVGECLGSALKTTAMVLFIVSCATMFSSYLTSVGTARELAAYVIGSGVSKWLFLILVFLVFLFLGCFIDGLSMMIVVLPTILPVLRQFGFDLVWFGVIVTVLIELGMLTPPMGINLFVIQGISKKSLNEVLHGTIPFFFIMLTGMIIMTIFPGIVTWLPSHMTN